MMIENNCVGGENYYPLVDELLRASPKVFKQLQEKCRKNLLSCILKDNFENIRQAYFRNNSLDVICFELD